MRSNSNRVRFLTLLSLMVLSLGACGSREPNAADSPPISGMNAILSDGEITAGWAPYPPFASLDAETGRPSGYYIELFEAFADEANLDVVWVETTWGNMISDSYAGKFDVMAAPVFRTIPRAKQVAFTRPIDYFGLGAVVRSNDERISIEADLNQAALKVAVVQGEVGHEYAKRHLSNIDPIVFTTGNISLALVEVVEGRADVGICDNWTASEFVKAHPESVKNVFKGSPLNPVGAGWFVTHREQELLTFLNASIDWLESSGTIAKISADYSLPSSSEN